MKLERLEKTNNTLLTLRAVAFLCFFILPLIFGIDIYEIIFIQFQDKFISVVATGLLFLFPFFIISSLQDNVEERTELYKKLREKKRRACNLHIKH